MTPVDGLEGYFMRYNNESIYRVYFLDIWWIETICILEFDEFDTKLMIEERKAEVLFIFLTWS